MTIRYQCDECGSVLKVKDELAGTAGKCPKCKKKFVVPQPNAENSSSITKAAKPKSVPAKESDAKSSEKTATSDTVPAPVEMKTEKPPAIKAAVKEAPVVAEKPEPATDTKPDQKKPAGGDDFDLDAFLMADGPVKVPPAGANPGGAADAGTSKTGRKRIVPTMPGGEPVNEPTSKTPTANATSANARDLLSKTMDDARVKASAMPEEKKRGPIFDFSGVKQEAKQAAPYIGGFIVVFGLVLWMSLSAFSNKIKTPPLARVSGTVMVGDKPFANVKVNLTPVDREIEVDGKKMRVRTSTGITDENGYYELDYMVGIKGAYIGKSRIWLEAVSVKDLKKIPPEYISISNDIREVKEAGNEGKFNLDLK